MLTNDIEITKADVAESASLSFSKRLRNALGEMAEGDVLTIRTMQERTHVTNIIGQVQKKQSKRFTTKLVVRRDADPENKIVLQIKRLPAE